MTEINNANAIAADIIAILSFPVNHMSTPKKKKMIEPMAQAMSLFGIDDIRYPGLFGIGLSITCTFSYMFSGFLVFFKKSKKKESEL